MKMIVLALAGTIAVATPAYAQSSYGSYREASSDRRIDALHYQVDEGIRRGTISRGEAMRLTDQLWQIRRLENEYARNGFSSWERTDLDRRITFLQDQLRGQDDGDYRRGDGYDPYAGYGADTSGGGSPPPGYQEDYPQNSDNPAYSEYPDHDTPGIQTYDPDNDYVPLDQGGASDPGYSDGDDDPYGLQGTDLDDYNGANDDAAGTTAVIMLAKYFKALGNNERTIVFAAFTAEEVGGFGSQHFSKQFDPAKVMAMFNIEMIGTDSKWGKNSAYITGYEKTDMGTILQKNLEGTGFTFYPDPYTDQQLFYRSDNATLARLGVPAHTISTSKMDNEPNYHKVSDHVETLDMANMAMIIKSIALSSISIIAGKDTPSRVNTADLR